MISVVIFINERPIKVIHAVNKTTGHIPDNKEHPYVLSGDVKQPKKIIKHIRSDGAIELAKKMLDEAK